MQIIPIRAFRPALAPAPRILPDDMDDLLEQRVQAYVLALTAVHGPRIPFSVVRRQGDYARRLDALAAQRGQE